MDEKFRLHHRGDFHEARDRLEEIMGDTFFDGERERIRDGVRNAYRALSAGLPTCDAEMGEICAIIEDSLRPTVRRAKAIEDTKTRSYVRKLLLEIYGIRVRMRRCVKNYMRKEGLWQSMDLSTEDLAVDQVRVVVSTYLGFPDPSPEVGSEEFEDCRKRLLSLTFSEIREFFGFEPLLRDSSGTAKFDNVAEFMDRAFPEYEIGEEFRSRLVTKKWVGPLLRKNVTAAAHREFGVPLVVPDKGTPEWEEARSAILRITHKSMMDSSGMACSGVITNSDRSAYDVLAEVFGEDYDLTSELLAKKDSPTLYKWTSREECISNVRDALGSCASYGGDQSAGTTIWWSRIQNLAISQRDASSTYQLGGGFNGGSAFFSSHVDMVMAAFPKVGLERWHFTGVGRKIVATRVKGGYSVAPREDDMNFIKLVMSADLEEALDLIEARFDTSRCRPSKYVDMDTYNCIVRYKFLEHVLRMGIKCPINVAELWKIVRKQVFTLIKNRITLRDGDLSDLLPPGHPRAAAQ